MLTTSLHNLPVVCHYNMQIIPLLYAVEQEFGVLSFTLFIVSLGPFTFPVLPSEAAANVKSS